MSRVIQLSADSLADIIYLIYESNTGGRISDQPFAVLFPGSEKMKNLRVITDELTYGVDGDRDAIGRYLLGLSNDTVYAEHSL